MLLEDFQSLRALNAKLLRAFQEQMVAIRVREPGLIVPGSLRGLPPTRGD